MIGGKEKMTLSFISFSALQILCHVRSVRERGGVGWWEGRLRGCHALGAGEGLLITQNFSFFVSMQTGCWP